MSMANEQRAEQARIAMADSHKATKARVHARMEEFRQKPLAERESLLVNYRKVHDEDSKHMSAGTLRMLLESITALELLAEGNS